MRVKLEWYKLFSYWDECGWSYGVPGEINVPAAFDNRERNLNDKVDRDPKIFSGGVGGSHEHSSNNEIDPRIFFGGEAGNHEYPWYVKLAVSNCKYCLFLNFPYILEL